jgi:hypothetical protein
MAMVEKQSESREPANSEGAESVSDCQPVAFRCHHSIALRCHGPVVDADVVNQTGEETGWIKVLTEADVETTSNPFLTHYPFLNATVSPFQ